MKSKFFLLAKCVSLAWAACSSGQDILDHWRLRDVRGLTKVRFLNGQFIGVGTNGTILTSPDGRVWTARNSGTTNDLKSVTWAPPFFPINSVFVAVGNAGTIVKSSDAVNWTVVSTPYLCNLNDVTYDVYNLNFIAATTARDTNTPNFLISQSGEFWTGVFIGQNFNPASGLVYRMDAVFASSYVIVAAGSSTIADEIWQSQDGGSTWTNRSLADQIVNGIAYSNGRLVMIGWEGRPVISTNSGDSWFSSNDTNVCAAPQNGCDFGQDLTFGPSAFVVVRSFTENGLVTSGDGATWTNRSGLTGLRIETIAFGNGTFVAAGATGIYRAEVAPPVLLAEWMAASNAIRLTISSELGRYRLQSSSNFSSWGDVLSFTNKGPPYEFVEAIDKSLAGRFYRVISP